MPHSPHPQRITTTTTTTSVVDATTTISNNDNGPTTDDDDDTGHHQRCRPDDNMTANANATMMTSNGITAPTMACIVATR